MFEAVAVAVAGAIILQNVYEGLNGKREIPDYTQENELFRQKKAEEAARQEENLHPDRTKRTKLYADSAEKLLEKIQTMDWNQIKTEGVQQTGSRFDLSI